MGRDDVCHSLAKTFKKQVCLLHTLFFFLLGVNGKEAHQMEES